MARWSPTVLPYAPDPFEAGDRVVRGVFGAAQLHQGQQRIDEFARRGDIMAQESEWRQRGAEAGLRDKYGWEGEGAPDVAPDSQAGGPGLTPGGAKEGFGLDMPEYAPPSQSVSTRATPNLSSDPSVAGPLGAMPQFGPGDVRNQPEVMERLQMVTGGSMAQYGQRPQDVHEAGERQRQGGMLYDTYAESLGLDPRAQAIMEETGQLPPVMKAYQTAGYGSAEDMAEDAYDINRVNPTVLSALIRAQSSEGGGGISAQRQNDILTERFNDSVAAYISAERSAGHEVSVEQAYLEVMSSDPQFRGVNTSMLDFAGDYSNMFDVTPIGGIAVPGEGETAASASQTTGFVFEVLLAANKAATLDRIRNTQGEDVAKAVLKQLALTQGVQWMQRFGITAYLGE